MRCKLRSIFFQTLLRNSLNSFFPCYSFCCNKMFSHSFLSISSLHFFITGFFSLPCYCKVSTYFEISLNNLFPKRHTNKNRWKKTFNSCVAIERKVFSLSCDAKKCKNCTFLFEIYKISGKEGRRLRTWWDWP